MDNRPTDAPGAAPADLGADPSYNIEVVCRTHSADAEPTAHHGVVVPAGPAKPAPAHRRRKGPKSSAAVHPSADDAPDSSPANLHAPGGDRRSVFDMADARAPRAAWRVRTAAVLDGAPFTVASIIFTILILYSDLFRAAFFPPSADPYFLAFTVFAICFFVAEIVVSALAKPAYFCKFYFFMDVLAALSLLTDIPGFTDAITFNDDDANHHVTLERAAKSAQAGARAARIMQVIALIQLIHLKAQRLPFVVNRGAGGLTEDGSSAGEGDPAAPALLGVKTQSRIGEKVTERTMRKVILGVLLLLLVLPVFDINVFFTQPTTLEDGGLGMLHDLYQQEGSATESFRAAAVAYVQDNAYNLGTSRTGFVYRLIVWNVTLMDTDPELRKDEKHTSVVETPECETGPSSLCFQSKSWVNVKWAVRMQAMLDIGRVTFLLAVLSIASLLFIRDTDELVLQPIERMVNKVKSVSQNPLAHQAVASAAGKAGAGGKQLETRILEHSITKICSLLSVGFGEAGAEVIADNIKSGGDLNPMVPGRKVMAIFGFCDIRQFTDTTEVLQEEIMEFVNSIASIVHTEVSLHGGAANKNIGDAFLLVWKLPGSAGQGALPRARSSVIGAKAAAAGAAGLEAQAQVTHLADAALASFVVIQAALKRSLKLHGYTKRGDLNARMPNFAVKMGFGLHVGWAIEGAIGSKYKIDASYLSPHVNMAARLEAATKQFGTSLLLSQPFADLLSPAVRRRVRQIDCVTVKGSNQPIGLYTYDVSTDRVTAPEQPLAHPAAAAAAAAAAKKTAEHDSFSDYPYYDEFEEHPDILATSAVDAAFLAQFAVGFEAYRSGDWAVAGAALEATRVARRDAGGGLVVDGPSETLLAVMREHGMVAPPGWAGFRELTEK